ncbi:MAG: hypothetical protein ABSD58_15435 [Verrucomicrobiia bacterium]|jgi:hypothetical protein
MPRSASSQRVEWHIGFFVKGIPHPYFIHSPKKLRMARIGDPALPGIEQLKQKHPSFSNFFLSPDRWGVIFVAVRAKVRSESEAVEEAWGLLEQIRDGLALVLDVPPKVAPIMILRQAGNPDARVVHFTPTSWMFLNAKKADITQAWEKRCDALLNSLLPFFDASLAHRWQKHSSLTMQIINSARLYRLGCESQSYGLEFLCKFAAMENLVAGTARWQKARKLRERIPMLIKNTKWDVARAVTKLWKLRNSAVHEARLEYLPKWEKSFPLEVLVSQLEFITTAVFVFALQNMKKARTVSGLWRLANTYQLPSWAARERPKEIRKLPGRTIRGSRGEIWTNAGTWFDPVFQAQLRSRRRQAKNNDSRSSGKKLDTKS